MRGKLRRLRRTAKCPLTCTGHLVALGGQGGAQFRSNRYSEAEPRSEGLKKPQGFKGRARTHARPPGKKREAGCWAEGGRGEGNHTSHLHSPRPHPPQARRWKGRPASQSVSPSAASQGPVRPACPASQRQQSRWGREARGKEEASGGRICALTGPVSSMPSFFRTGMARKEELGPAPRVAPATDQNHSYCTF